MPHCRTATCRWLMHEWQIHWKILPSLILLVLIYGVVNIVLPLPRLMLNIINSIKQMENSVLDNACLVYLWLSLSLCCLSVCHHRCAWPSCRSRPSLLPFSPVHPSHNRFERFSNYTFSPDSTPLFGSIVDFSCFHFECHYLFKSHLES